jgi:hypothetical protein
MPKVRNVVIVTAPLKLEDDRIYEKDDWSQA